MQSLRGGLHIKDYEEIMVMVKILMLMIMVYTHIRMNTSQKSQKKLLKQLE